MELSKRKHPRLKNRELYISGDFFVTLCTHKRRRILSSVVGRGLAPAEIQLTEYGKIAKEQLFALEDRYPGVKIAHYVIMPDHIHIIVNLHTFGIATTEENPYPSLMDVMRVYKSLTTRFCKAYRPIDKLFQTTYFEHIIRNKEDYAETVSYITSNPSLWYHNNK